MFRALLTSASACALLATTVCGQAADLPVPVKAPARAPAATIYNWTGFYLGVNGGGAWGRSFWDSAGPFNVSGGLVGGTIGYNYQIGPWVLGVEGDGDWSNIRGGTTNAGCPAGCTTQNNWFATARGRVGYAFDRVLPYVTAGGAFGDIQPSSPGFAGATSERAGWTVGGGLEFALIGNLTGKVEYLYADLGRFDCGLGCGLAAPDNVAFRTNIVRAGLNYRF